MIPKLIHQVWNEEDVSSYGRTGMGLRSQASLKRDYSDCEYKVWTHEEIEKIMRDEEFKYIKQMYDKVEIIKKADIGRLVVLKKYGGLYFDLDIISHSKIENVFEMEFVAYKRGHIHGLANSFIGSSVDHHILNATLKSISEVTDSTMGPIQHTGPHRLQLVCEELNMLDNIHILKSNEFGNQGKTEPHKYATHYKNHNW